ncbi:hypothetical protein GUF49_13940, partial [Xanthomonas citri pv. citri]|nr:hypothetical protein [Xanthomonas citri pv. citri]
DEGEGEEFGSIQDAAMLLTGNKDNIPSDKWRKKIGVEEVDEKTMARLVKKASSCFMALMRMFAPNGIRTLWGAVSKALG